MDTAYRSELGTASCAHCGWPTAEARVLSTHHTSEGWVRYRRCACGAVAIELVRLDERRTVHA